jgi:uncharacterized protein YndB with AHSA1/START domain
MNAKNLSFSMTVEQSPAEVFAAINDVRAWWTGDVEGRTTDLGDEFTYRYKDMHYSKQKVTESIPGKRVVWRVIDSKLAFVENKTEWNGTEVTFDIAKNGDKTELRFTHAGLVPDLQCYEDCSRAWRSLVTGNLRTLIAERKERLTDARSARVRSPAP